MGSSSGSTKAAFAGASAREGIVPLSCWRGLGDGSSGGGGGRLNAGFPTPVTVGMRDRTAGAVELAGRGEELGGPCGPPDVLADGGGPKRTPW